MVKISDGQKFALNKLIGQFTQSRSCRLWILSKLFNKTITTTSDLEITDWRFVRDRAYPNWSNNDWEVCKEFTSEIQQLCDEYEEEIIGQKKLF